VGWFRRLPRGKKYLKRMVVLKKKTVLLWDSLGKKIKYPSNAPCFKKKDQGAPSPGKKGGVVHPAGNCLPWGPYKQRRIVPINKKGGAGGFGGGKELLCAPVLLKRNKEKKLV